MFRIKNVFLKARVGFHFYKKLWISSAGLNLLLIFLQNPIESTLLIKIFLIGLIFAEYKYLDTNNKLLFYKNFGITPLNLFIYTVFLDLVLSILMYKIINLIQ